MSNGHIPKRDDKSLFNAIMKAKSGEMPDTKPTEPVFEQRVTAPIVPKFEAPDMSQYLSRNFLPKRQDSDLFSAIKNITEAKTEPLSEGLRKLESYASKDGKKEAHVYRDAQWGDHIVKYHKDGKHLTKADSHHYEDKEDAHDSAKHFCKEEVVAEAQAHDDEIAGHLEHLKSNLKMHPSEVNDLRHASDLAKQVGKHEEDSPAYKQAHSDFAEHLINWRLNQGSRSDVVGQHPEGSGFSRVPIVALHDVAKNGVKPWIENGKFGMSGRHDYNMTAMHLGDASDHLALAIHAANGDHDAFHDVVNKIDTNPREEIPSSAWNLMSKDHPHWKRNVTESYGTGMAKKVMGSHENFPKLTPGEKGSMSRKIAKYVKDRIENEQLQGRPVKEEATPFKGLVNVISNKFLKEAPNPEGMDEDEAEVYQAARQNAWLTHSNPDFHHAEGMKAVQNYRDAKDSSPQAGADTGEPSASSDDE